MIASMRRATDELRPDLRQFLPEDLVGGPPPGKTEDYVIEHSSWAWRRGVALLEQYERFGDFAATDRDPSAREDPDLRLQANYLAKATQEIWCTDASHPGGQCSRNSRDKGAEGASGCCRARAIPGPTSSCRDKGPIYRKPQHA